MQTMTSKPVIRYIEKKELKEFFQLGANIDDEYLLNQMVKEADSDSDGLISIKEFKNIISAFYDKLNKD